MLKIDFLFLLDVLCVPLCSPLGSLLRFDLWLMIF
jgi:hypothetical protein